MFLKQIFAQEAKLWCKHASFKTIRIPRGSYQTNIVLIIYQETELFSTFFDERRESKMSNFGKKTDNTLFS